VRGKDFADERSPLRGQLEALTLKKVLKAVHFALNDGHEKKKTIETKSQ